MEPMFLELGEVLEIHEDQITRYGGSLGVRDMGLLESALGMPKAGIGGQYFHTTIAEMWAAYLFYLCKNHPFIDGNKRVAAAASRVFLLMNDHAFNPPEREFEDITLAVAAGAATKEDAIAFFRKHVRRTPRRKR